MVEYNNMRTEADIQSIREFIAQLRNDERFMSYADDSIGIRRTIAEINQFLSRNTIEDSIRTWGLNCEKKYEKIIECLERYKQLHYYNETRMETIENTLPDVISSIDNDMYIILDKICRDKHDVEDIISLLRKTRIVKDKKFNLYNIMEHWDPNAVINMYRDGKIDIEYMRQCFYFNACTYCVQTINYDKNDRYIQKIDGIDDLIQYLDLYHNVYMSYDAPNTIFNLPLDILIIESLTGTIYDKLIRYIKDNGGVVHVQDIRSLSKEYEHGIGINGIIRELNNTYCIDITYGVKDLPTSLEVGSIVRCSIKGHNNSVSIGYMLFNGKIPNNVRVSKQLMKYCFD